MKRAWLASAACCGFIASLAVSAPAFAQQQDDEAAGPEVDAITVTAQRREENLQDVPLSVTALSAEDLEERSVTAVSDLQRVTPGLSFRNSTTDNLTPLIALRGQAQTRSDLGKQPSVGLYYDGIYMPTATGTTLNGGMLDVQRVEILRGPQGTLYGRNTPGGAINIISRSPTQEFEGLLQTYAGNNELYGVGGVLNVPLGDQAAFRVVVQHQRDGGYGYDVINDNELGDSDVDAIRGTFRLDGNDALEIVIRGDYTDAHSGGQVSQNVAFVTPSVAARQAAAELGFANDAPGQSAARAAVLASLPTGDYDTALSYRTFSDVVAWGTSLTVSLDLSDTLQLRSISGYRSFEKHAVQDPDGLPTDVIGCNPDCARVNFDQWTQEVTLNLNTDRLTGVAGIYYHFLDSYDSLDSTPAPNALPSGLIANHAWIEDESWSGFGQLTFAVTPAFNITGGVRYTDEENVLLANNFNALACNVPVPNRINGTCFGRFVNDFSAWSWLLSADYHLTDNVMLYLSGSRGFKAGGQNTFGSALAGSYDPFDSEFALQYETGLKADLFNRRLRTNLALYYTDYTDIQRAVTAQLPAGGVTTVTQNAANGRIYGVELEATYLATDNLQFQLGASYTNAAYEEYQTFLGDYSDHVFPNTPEWQISGAAIYSWPTSFGEIQAVLDFYHQSEVDFDPDNHSVNSGVTGLQDAYTIYNARASVEIDSADIEISAWVRNLTDEFYLAGGVDITGGLGVGNRYPAPPRTYGVQLTKRF